ncbi:3-dehydroquinate synthase [Sphingomonas sp. KRR8]|uniref:3-dehydroquinate synthase family protein n=1 Tax=Sphingomonas sp. KRR8 TaxID=2942996 RepID=UPI002022535C|nr:3-dehydroquinate synthase family protein [Sphingomonas sp. KRR8]URD61201.1 3-dehydroquinate synthase [Sphingomonas sp. KRR8]
MTVITVTAGDRSYDVVVAPLADSASRLAALGQGQPLPVVTEPKVWALHGAALQSLLPCDPILVPEGEEAKQWPHLQALIGAFTTRNLDRKRPVLAFGGGAVGDLTGLAAGLFKRGLPVVHVPTTLLAQADSAVGGKTAIDAEGQKNLVGIFHQPALVLADPALTLTLDPRQSRAGYAEIVKYGLIDQPDFFAWCEANGAALLAGDLPLRSHAVAHSVAAKARFVAADVEDRTGVRALLNLGHTFGHAIESAAGIGTVLHGEAVALGMVLAYDFSATLGLCPVDDANRVRSHVESVGLPTRLSDLKLGRAVLLPLMGADKKNDGGKLKLVLARGIGHAFLSDGADPAALADFLTCAA